MGPATGATTRSQTRRATAASVEDGPIICRLQPPRCGDERGRSYDGEGRVDLALLQRLGVPHGADFYICGPAG